MKLVRCLVIPSLLCAVLFSGGCETSQPKNTAAKAPAQATAPTVVADTAAPAKAEVPRQQRSTPSDPVDALIAQADKLYQAGQKEYEEGHLEAARQSFDQAFNVMLSSNLDLRDNPRLEKEFDKIVDGVRDLEQVALREGDGFTEQRFEPAPIDEANDITFPVDPSVRAKAEAEIKTTKSDLPLMLNDQVAMFINYFSSTKGRHTLEHGLTRAGLYREMVSQTFQQVGVPQDLIYLAMAESGFQPLAVSRAGARGMWQFMAGRGSMYGLDRNWWVDDRQDPVKSTQAAAHHLKDLYNEFGDWYLAMAAYNTGPGNIQHAVERTGYADFWELYKRGVLPQETRNYVPIIVAVTIMAKNPAQYGLENVVPEKPVATDQVSINYPVDLRLVAECLDTSEETLQQLNPSLLRMTTPKDQAFTLNLPAGSKDKYETAIALIPPDMRTFWRYHRVEYGESLSSIARKYHTSTGVIEEANNLSSDEVTVGSKLIIPIGPGEVRRHGGVFAQGDALQGTQGRYGGLDRRRLPGSGGQGPQVEPPEGQYRGGGPYVIDLQAFGWFRRAGDGGRRGRPGAVQVGQEGQNHRWRRNQGPSRPQTARRPPFTKSRRAKHLAALPQSYNTTVANLKKNNANLSANLRPGEVLVIHK